MKTAQKHLLALALAVSAVLPLSATQYVLEDYATTLEDSSAQAWDGLFEGNLQLGIFAAGFTPTATNTADWAANWLTGGNGGYYDSSGPEWSVHLLLTDNLSFAIGQQLSLWIFDVQSPGSQWALLTDSSWLVQASSALDASTHFLGFSPNTTALFGSFDLDAGTARTAAPGAAVPDSANTALLLASACLALLALNKRDLRTA